MDISKPALSTPSLCRLLFLYPNSNLLDLRIQLLCLAVNHMPRSPSLRNVNVNKLGGNNCVAWLQPSLPFPYPRETLLIKHGALSLLSLDAVSDHSQQSLPMQWMKYMRQNQLAISGLTAISASSSCFGQMAVSYLSQV